MAMYSVKWYSDPRDPRSSYWYECNGVITYCSGLLKEWEGGDHRALVRYFHRRDMTVMWVGKGCVPPTKVYHQKLLDNVNALLRLLDHGSS